MTQLSGKVAIVTGAASGFGAEIARQYVAQGAKVVVAAINEAGRSPATSRMKRRCGRSSRRRWNASARSTSS